MTTQPTLKAALDLAANIANQPNGNGGIATILNATIEAYEAGRAGRLAAAVDNWRRDQETVCLDELPAMIEIKPREGAQ